MLQNYINQLVEDLLDAATNPPSPHYIESPPHMKQTPDISELALVPFKPISELVGIQSEFFPDMMDLNTNQCKQVNDAIFKVFDSLHLELVDEPPGLPPEILYDVLTTNWQHPVQYLPLSGMDVELCSRDPLTCPYGDYCNCSGDMDEEEEIPTRFEKIIPKITESIDARFICYINPETLEIEKISKTLMDDMYKYKLTPGYILEDEKLKHENWNQYYVFEPLESHESFKIMEVFVEALEDKKFSEQLLETLNHEKPFANFKWKIDTSSYQQTWLDFKQKWLENHVKQIIWAEINRVSFFDEEINSFYNEDGTTIDPENVPVPSLCVICQNSMADDWEENLLCLINRNDKRNDDDFRCRIFRKIN
ncbi:hypothetical protein OU798_15955 [Prolixibacteraceae bacterium Z1-6]|uniref:Uncharacterized protein n=1 Tax=Draconibacterium aestuarii TaxID=2998507 RepID=A0A9X3F797_9BACT|nr:hypothetical protein [Prolixibacteraceae bacterium Z1-6]